jgi:hypothetical protein
MSDEAAKKLSHLSSRQVALERNDPKNFMEGPAYNVAGGHPITKSTPAQVYKEPAMPKPTPKATETETKPPFVVKGA